MRRQGVVGAGAAHGLTVRCDDPAALDGAGTRVEPGPHTVVEVYGVQVLQHPADGGLPRAGPPHL